MKVAPIVFFVYNRVGHTHRTIEALQENQFAGDSELIIYSDAPKDTSAIKKVQSVRDYIKTIDGFRKVSIIEQEENQGLAKSIITGVTDVVNKYGRVIVIEDDLVTSPYFLKFMNEALGFYKDNKNIWHISGWNYPMSGEGLGDVFASQVMNCWGWATWSDRWQYFEKDTDKLIKEFSLWNKIRFNLYGVESFWKQVRLNKIGKLDTWAIYWYATIFKQDGLCINPSQSFVQNIGLDGSGTNCGVVTLEESLQKNNDPVTFENVVSQNKLATLRIMCSICSRRSTVLVNRFL